MGSEVKYASEPLLQPPLPSSQQRPSEPPPLSLKITRTKTVVAVMIIDKTKTISAMRHLQHHPNILKIHKVMAAKTKIYLVMELATKGELFAKVLRRGRLSDPATRHYFSQLVYALHFCHQNNVVHRDVKPQNLLLDQNRNLKV
ncbi:hypothetical protein GQ457_07G014380 [Hibiscus cannabinus]